MYISLILSLFILIFSVIKNISIGYSLTACFVLFVIYMRKDGFKINDILKISYRGGKKSFVVLKIFFLIGALVGIWMASGTIPAIVYYCLKYISPSKFILSAFLISCATSFLIGTAFGTVSVIGIPLMVLARSTSMDLNVVAGAIIAGAYFGDRCSPMSSSAYLIANLTQTDVFVNIKNMLYTSILPFSISLIFYYILSFFHPLQILNDDLSIELIRVFNVNAVLLLPALIILLLSLFKVNIKISMLASILSTIVIGFVYQNHQVVDLVYYIVFGFKSNQSIMLQNIIKGGGITSMLKTCYIVFVACVLSGVFEEIKIFDKLKKMLLNMNLKAHKLFGITTLVSIVTGAFGCSQSISIVMTSEIMKDCYSKDQNYEFALNLENSAVLISPLIPWNIASLFATTTLNVSSSGHIIYAFYLYILPLIHFIRHWGRTLLGKHPQRI